MNELEMTYIMEIAKHQSITKAANALFLSQPHLSRTLMRVEEELGVQIFDRSRLPLRLTYAGERYLAYCRKFEQLKREMKEEFENLASSNVSRLTVGVPPIRGSYLLPIVLPVFSRAYPQVEVVIHEAHSNVIPKLIETGEIDIGVFSLPQKPPRINCRKILRDRLLLMLPPEHPLFYTNEDQDVILPLQPGVMELLDGEKFISIDSQYSITKRLIHYLEKFGIHCSISIKTKNNVMTYRLCEQGMGLAVIMEVAAHNTIFHRRPCFYLLGDPPLDESWYAAWRADRPLSSTETQFLKVIYTHAEDMIKKPIPFSPDLW